MFFVPALTPARVPPASAKDAASLLIPISQSSGNTGKAKPAPFVRAGSTQSLKLPNASAPRPRARPSSETATRSEESLVKRSSAPSERLLPSLHRRLPPARQAFHGQTSSETPIESARIALSPVTVPPSLENPPVPPLDEKLKMAELIHSKLYKRNLELESELAAVRLELKGWQAATLEYDEKHGNVVDMNAPSSVTVGSGKALEVTAVTAADVTRMVDTHAQQVQYLNSCITEKDEIIQDLRKTLVDGGSAAVAAHATLATQELQRQLEATRADCDRIHSAYTLLKGKYDALIAQKEAALNVQLKTRPPGVRGRGRRRQLRGRSTYGTASPLRSEWQGAKSESRARSATMAGQTLHALDFVRSLSEKLSVSEKQRAQEADAFAKRLLEAEQSSCDRYVEKKLLLDRITELTDHIAERDDVDRKVEACIRVIFKRISELEAGVVVLKRRLVVANSRNSTHPGDVAAAVPTTAAGSEPVDDEYDEEFDEEDLDGYGNESFDEDGEELET